MSGFFEDVNNGIQQSPGREGVTLEAVECGESEGRYQLALYFSHPVFADGLAEDDRLRDFIERCFFDTRDDDGKQVTEGLYAQVEIALNADKTAMAVRGPKKQVLEMLRTNLNTQIDREWNRDVTDYQGLAYLRSGDIARSDQDLLILKTTGKLPEAGGPAR